jgi:UDP-N-acetylmuramoyl-L-alanyl-D-glutamate--2,6-diaminopimelate ligase
VRFSAALFTNLTHDHLDYHGDLASYGAAKAKLFAAPELAWAAINCDDAFGRELVGRARAQRVWGYGASAGEVRLAAAAPRENGLRLEIVTPAGKAVLESALVGRVNAANLLAVSCALAADGVPVEEFARVAPALTPAPGRMEVFGAKRGPRAVVDYAHTPDALERALGSLREHCRGALWCVFGCGGDRDRAKRPRMGEIAERLSDVVILTDDNPRSEDPEAIVREIVAGMRAVPKIIHDRAQAIAHALAHAAAHDWVLIAGKGHETTQQFATRRLPLSDRGVVRKWLEDAA